MFCPTCGAKNDNPGASCFVCGHALPSGSSFGASERGSSERKGTRERKRGQRVQLGSLGDRTLALFLDRLIIVIVGLLPLAWWGRNRMEAGATIDPFWSTIVLTALYTATVFIYHFLLESLAGTTPGKLLFGMRVVNDGEKEKFPAFALRNVLRVVDALLLGLIGFVVALLDEKNRRVGDFVGGTLVIYTPLRRGEVIALMVTYALLLAGAVWLSTFICPECPDSLSAGFRETLVRLVGRS